MTKWKVAIAIILLIAAGMLYAQNRATAVSTINITKEEMESFVKSIPPDDLRTITGQPEGKKMLVDRLKEMFTLSLEAERLGIDTRPEVQSDLGLMEKVVLARLFRDRKAAEQPKAIEVTEADRAEFYKNNPNAFDQFVNSNTRFKSLPAEQREGLKNQFAEMQILVERAKRMGLEQDKDYQIAQKVQRASYLASRMQQELHSTLTVNDDDLKAYYESHKQQFEETRASHILVMFPEQREQRGKAQEKKEGEPAKPATKEEARKRAEELLARVKAGEDFAKLAKEYSDDTGSGQQGGDLGFFRKDVRFVPEFKEAVFKLKPGEVSGIVETQFGYHIIKVNEQRTAPFDETMKAELKDEILEKKVQDRIDSLKAKNLVKIDENFTLPTPPPAPPKQLQLPPGHPGQPPQPGAEPGHDSHEQGAPEKE